jgi:flavin reductase (DIM6/NTAB) family NADH-FMN oxidoreductase RutF
MTITPTAFDPRELRGLFGRFPSGVAALCALVDGEPQGMAASSFTSVSLDPPLVSICIRKESSTWPALKTAGQLGVSILSAEHETHARALAGRAESRFSEVAWRATDEGAVLVDGSVALLGCVLEDELDAGDHVIALLRITTVHEAPDALPLVFHGSRFRRLSD